MTRQERRVKPSTQKDPHARTPVRSLRISDDVWTPAVERANEDGVSTGEVIRRALIKYLSLDGTTGVAGRRDQGQPQGEKGDGA